jgi:hypothetical protein
MVKIECPECRGGNIELPANGEFGFCPACGAGRRAAVPAASNCPLYGGGCSIQSGAECAAMFPDAPAGCAYQKGR